MRYSTQRFVRLRFACSSSNNHCLHTTEPAQAYQPTKDEIDSPASIAPCGCRAGSSYPNANDSSLMQQEAQAAMGRLRDRVLTNCSGGFRVVGW